ncbi:MAG: ATP-binding protein [Dermatophilaceae bacterium]
MAAEVEGMALRPSARLQKYLGRELIADPNLAIIEFVKNAYDAGASDVIVEFELASGPSSLTISDNGIGMDEDSFRTNWLRPGFSQKSPDYKGPRDARPVAREAQRRALNREPSGEKGLGRLASGRLGEVLEVWTRRTSRDPWLHVIFNWSDFDDMQQYMDQVPIPYDQDPPAGAPIASGTIVRIENLRQNWAGRVAGRPAPGRKRTRLGRLKQDLELLIRPYRAHESEFAIDLRSDSYLDPSDVGKVTAETADREADYVYDFEIDTDFADYVVVRRRLRRSEEIALEVGQPREVEYQPYVVNARAARNEHRSPELRCGPFAGTFFYTPPPKARRAKTIDAAASGVLLYRDGILVEPYGLPGDDWVGVEARKASRQGHAAIQPATFSGNVRISRSENPELEEMANRLGLLESDASDDFFGHVQAEFAFFENIVYNELVVARWTPLAEKATETASQAGALARVQTRALIHSIGQPLQALGFEVLRLEVLAKRADLPKEARAKLDEIRARMEGHLEALGRKVERVADIREPEISVANIADLVAAAVLETATLAAMAGVEVRVEEIDDCKVLAAEALVIEVLGELVMNAIEVPRPEGRQAHVVLTSSHTPELGVIRVSDNGIGLPELQIPDRLEDIPSRSGRPPEGLATIAMAMSISRGAVEVLETSENGTAFEVRIPRLLRAVASGVD